MSDIKKIARAVSLLEAVLDQSEYRRSSYSHRPPVPAPESIRGGLNIYRRYPATDEAKPWSAHSSGNAVTDEHYATEHEAAMAVFAKRHAQALEVLQEEMTHITKLRALIEAAQQAAEEALS